MADGVQLASKILGRPLVDTRDVVRSCYAHLLLREPDAEGLEAYSAFLASGGQIDDAIKDFAGSEEFERIMVERSRALHSLFFAEEVVEGLCRALLDREADAHNLAHFSEMLNGGAGLATAIRRLPALQQFQHRSTAEMLHGAADQPLTIIQTCDGPNYYPLLQEGRRANEGYALRNGFRYECFIGIKRGYHPWHACFNRIVMLQDMMHNGYRGWIFYLDADAYIFDQQFDLLAYLNQHSDKALIAGAGGPTGHRWDINDGAFLINLGHPLAREIVARWNEHFLGTPDAELREAEEWESVPSDQPRLHEILRNHPHLMEGLRVEERELFNDYGSSFVRQALRGHGMTIEDRLRLMQRDLAANAANHHSASPPATADIIN